MLEKQPVKFISPKCNLFNNILHITISRLSRRQNNNIAFVNATLFYKSVLYYNHTFKYYLLCPKGIPTEKTKPDNLSLRPIQRRGRSDVMC